MVRGSSSSHQPPAQKEKQRRDRMKDLCSTLAALLRIQPSERIPLPELLERATTSLELLKERVEGLKSRKEELEKEVDRESERRLQVVQVRESGDLTLEANLVIMANNKKLVPSQMLKVIEEGGTQITNSSFSTVGNHIYCTIHAQAFHARVGFDAALIQSQLLKLIY